MENQDNYWLNRFLKHKDKASEHLFYAIRRIDLLIISISGAGIYVVFETLRFVYKEPILLDVYYLKLAGCSFAAAIITNFFSQWAGYATNSYEEKYAEEEIKKERDEGFDKKNQMLLKNGQIFLM